MSQLVPITVAKGDGIGPEIMDATLHVLQEAGALIAPEYIEIGEQVYMRGNNSGIDQSAWESLERTRVFLKAPITTPQGGGFKSLNVTTRKTLGLFANVRPCRAYHPFVDTKYPDMNLVIIRENEEDLYAGIEHRQTSEVYQCLKIISRPGCEKIVRYAFEYARVNNRKKVTCFSKDNIMKMTDGLFHKVFDEIGAEYPNIEKEHWIIDIGSAKMADTPEIFDVIVTLNLYGDIISDISAQIAGSVGLAGSSNIGVNYAMFEAIHGSAPRRAGQNMANPSGLLNGALLMLTHLGQLDIAERIENAYLRTLEEGTHTYDVFREGVSKTKVGTREFAEAIVKNLGKMPEKLKPASYPKDVQPIDNKLFVHTPKPPVEKVLAGVDIFVDWNKRDPDELHALLSPIIDNDVLKIAMISNRGTKVWPNGNSETFCTDHWRIRVKAIGGTEKLVPIKHQDIADALGRLASKGIDFIKTEHLYFFEGEAGFTRSQGE
jgi:isocitrate dehydrogenase